MPGVQRSQLTLARKADLTFAQARLNSALGNFHFLVLFMVWFSIDCRLAAEVQQLSITVASKKSESIETTSWEEPALFPAESAENPASTPAIRKATRVQQTEKQSAGSFAADLTDRDLEYLLALGSNLKALTSEIDNQWDESISGNYYHSFSNAIQSLFFTEWSEIFIIIRLIE